MRICMILEGCYPWVRGGVSSWMHALITSMPQHEYVLWLIGAKAEDSGKYKYEIPKNVVEIHEVFLDDALRLRGTAQDDYLRGSGLECAFQALQQEEGGRDLLSDERGIFGYSPGCV